MTFPNINNQIRSIVKEEFEGKLDSETFKKCQEYSGFYFENFNGFPSTAQKDQLKQDLIYKADEIAHLEKDRKNILLNFFEDLVLKEGKTEFLLPLYILNPDVGPEVSEYGQLHSLSILGKVHDILVE